MADRSAPPLFYRPPSTGVHLQGERVARAPSSQAGRRGGAGAFVAAMRSRTSFINGLPQGILMRGAGAPVLYPTSVLPQACYEPMKHASESERQMAAVLNRLLDRIVLIILTLGTVAVIASLLRLPHGGLSANIALDIITFVGAVAVFPLRSRLGVKPSILIIFSLVCVNAIGNFYTTGLATPGFAILTAATVIVGVFIGLRGGVTVLVVSTLGIAAAGVLQAKGVIRPGVDTGAYLASAQAWIVQSSVYVLFASMSLIVVDTIQRSLKLSLIQREEQEHKLRQSEKMRAIGQLAGGVAHDFNNQLAGIIGFANLLQREAADELTREYAAGIVAAGGRAAELTAKLLAFARKGNYRSEPIEMHGIVDEVVSILSHSIDKRIALTTSLTADATVITGDAGQIQNALLNLAINARDAMPHGGTLRFETATEHAGCTPEPDTTPHAQSRLRVTVSDTGVGMEPSVIEHIFEPFFTTKPPGKGTGMGLAAVYGTVQSHQGSISVHSQPGKGTRFDLYFPLTTFSAAVKHPAAPKASHRGTGTVLVVEDEPAVRTLVERMLTSQGYTVTGCDNGVRGIELFEEMAHSIVLVVLDMILPGMGGGEFLSRIRATNPHTPVLLCSGYSSDGEMTDLLGSSATGFIAKPFTFDQFSESLNELMGNAET